MLALENAMLALTWRLAALEQQASPARAAAAALGRDAASFGARLHQIGAHAETRFPCRGACDAVADAPTRAQADLFLLFSAEKLQVGSKRCSQEPLSRTHTLPCLFGSTRTTMAPHTAFGASR